jgi:hypothetical protein
MASDSSSDDEDLYCNDDESVALHKRFCCARKLARAAHEAGPEGAGKLAKLEAVLRDAIQTPARRCLKLKSTNVEKLLTLAGAHDCFILAGFVPSRVRLVLAESAVLEAQAMAEVLRLVVKQFPSTLPANAPAPRSAAADYPAASARLPTPPLEAPPAAAAEEEESPSLVGCRVELVDIAAKPELNGRQGVAVNFDAAKGRYIVRLDGSLASDSMPALRPGNVRAVVVRSHSSPPEPAVALPPPMDPRGGVQYFHPERNTALTHIPFSLFDSLILHAVNKKPAERDVKYWGGAEQPWRNGTTDAPLDDPAVVAQEEPARAAAQAEDAARFPTAESHAVMLHGCGLRADFLYHMTYTLNLWDWATWEVVQFLVKPATEAHGRCRFVDLPFIKPYTGPATVFVSHCWGGNWGDLVAAVCAGGRMGRIGWIDVGAVRQWPGNEKDLNFRPVVKRCHALLVAAAPPPGVVSAKLMTSGEEHGAYLEPGVHESRKKNRLLPALVHRRAARGARGGRAYCASVPHHPVPPQ